MISWSETADWRARAPRPRCLFAVPKANPLLTAPSSYSSVAFWVKPNKRHFCFIPFSGGVKVAQKCIAKLLRLFGFISRARDRRAFEIARFYSLINEIHCQPEKTRYKSYMVFCLSR